MCAPTFCLGKFCDIRFRAFAIAFCLAFLLVPLSEKSASANCGDWLAHPETDVATVEMEGPGGLGANLPNEAPQPCEGPNCRRGQPLNELPIPAIPVSSSKDFNCSVKFVGLATGDFVGLLCAEYAIGTPARHHCRIDRPPIVY